MTRKHFEAIAATIKSADMGSVERSKLARDMASTLKEMNPNFDRSRFIEACGTC